MHFSTIFAAGLSAVSVASAIPAERRQVPTPVCVGTASNAECCAVNVLNLLDLNCAPPPTVPMNVTDFKEICADIGQQAQCCVIDLLGQGVICNPPAGL